jgi:hypothetical protein
MFGNPNNSIIGQGLEGALEILETTNSLYYIRATSSSGVDASATVKMGACPTFALSGDGWGSTSGCTLVLNGTKQDGTKIFTLDTSVTIASGQGITESAVAISNAIGTLDSSKLLSDTQDGVNFIAGAFAGHMTTLSVSAYTPAGDPFDVLRALTASSDTLAAPASNISISGITYDSGVVNSAAYLTESLYPGTGYNLATDTNGTVTGNSITVVTTGGAKSTLSVND